MGAGLSGVQRGSGDGFWHGGEGLEVCGRVGLWGEATRRVVRPVGVEPVDRFGGRDLGVLDAASGGCGDGSVLR